MGAIEGLRSGAKNGFVKSEEATRLFSDALEIEPDARNRRLMLDAIAATGGEDGVNMLMELALQAHHPSRADALVFVSQHTPPEQALSLLTGVLSERDLNPEVHASACRALAHLQDGSGTKTLLALVTDPTSAIEQRITGMQALDIRVQDPQVRSQLHELFQFGEVGVLRAEALGVIAAGSDTLDELDLREVAEHDVDVAVRKKAVELAAFDATEDAGGWLVDRFRNESNAEVRSAALTSLMERARAGDGSPMMVDALHAALDCAEAEEQRMQIAAAIAATAAPDFGLACKRLAQEAEFYQRAMELAGAADRADLQVGARRLRRCVHAVSSARQP
jgi:hypothetical protein